MLQIKSKRESLFTLRESFLPLEPKVVGTSNDGGDAFFGGVIGGEDNPGFAQRFGLFTAILSRTLHQVDVAGGILVLTGCMDSELSLCAGRNFRGLKDGGVVGLIVAYQFHGCTCQL
ncbi:hypothetical protein V6N12_023418 [Hibiscus sabdariffa]|uniref:Uncharacterized protein n=1 Tax=Hibiscus sabdariffa TaxID=183260 RepID=A0ABR2FXM3_9ROSI